MWTSTLLLALLAQQPLPPGSSTALPAGHPPLDAPPRAPEVTSGVASPGAAIPAGHPPVASGPAAGAAVTLDELVRRLDATPDLKTQDRPFEYSVSIGQLYFAQGRHADALVFFEQGVKKAEPVRTFYLERRRSAAKAAAGAAAALGCESGPATTMDSLFQKAQEYARAKRADAAALCAGEALRGLVALEPDLGHARFLLKDPAGAMAAYERALALFDTNTGARYGRAALRLDTSSEDVVVLAEVKADLQRVV
jgi:tetratricopeptide (TPR) repeat protein